MKFNKFKFCYKLSQLLAGKVLWKFTGVLEVYQKGCRLQLVHCAAPLS